MGVAYHANYLVWCEIGRTDYIRELGTTYAELERQGHYLAVAEANVRYRSAARYDDLVRVITTLRTVRSRAITFEYEIERVEPEPASLARATTTLVSLDAGGRPCTLPPPVLGLFGE
jgi:acyl-CoA thioester hydrolase